MMGDLHLTRYILIVCITCLVPTFLPAVRFLTSGRTSEFLLYTWHPRRRKRRSIATSPTRLLRNPAKKFESRRCTRHSAQARNGSVVGYWLPQTPGQLSRVFAGPHRGPIREGRMCQLG